MFPSWWRLLVKFSRGNQAALNSKRQQRARRQTYRPFCEAFEERIVPAVMSIPTNLSGTLGGTVTVPVNIDSLSGIDTSSGTPVAQAGLTGANVDLFFNPNVFTVSSSDVNLGTLATNGSTAAGNGYSPTNPNGWSVSVNNVTAGALFIGISDSGAPFTNTASGSLVTINFHIKANAPGGPTHIDLAADDFNGNPFAGVSDQNFGQYTLNPAPMDNTVLSPSYAYTGSDPTDGIVTLPGSQPPTANNVAYSITGREASTNPGLTVASPGVLATDTDPQGLSLTAMEVTGPTHGTVTLNSNGSFTYTPTIGYFGADSFTYEAFNGSSDSNVATVSLSVTERLSIPTNLTASAGGTVVVPINMDSPGGPGTAGGVIGASLAIDYNPNVFTITSSDIALGSLTSATNEVQTITFGGTVTGGTFTLGFNNTSSGGSINGVTGPITYSSTLATLQANIQSALNTLLGAGNSAVSAVSATSVTVTFQSAFAATNEPTMTSNSSLSGTGAKVTVAATTEGFGAWFLSTNVGTGAQLGQVGISLSSSTANMNTVGGSLATITFHVNNTAPAGPSPINLAATNSPGGVLTVTTDLDSISGSIPLVPAPTNASTDPVDGSVTITAATNLAVSAPANVTAGSAFNLTVTAQNANLTTNPGYVGTVHFTSTDAAAGLPADYAFTTADAGVHVFSVTLKTVASAGQTVTATDTITNITGTSSAITVSPAAATHFTLTGIPATVTTTTAVAVTVTAFDQFSNKATGYAGIIHFTSSDSQAVLPGNSALTNGAGTFTVTFKSAGQQTVTATDSASSTIFGTSSATTVTTATVTHFAVSSPSSASAGSPTSFTVVALDVNNNTVTNYAGTVQFTSSDSLATFPINDTTLTGGGGVFSATLKTVGAGTQTITVTDTANSISGTSGPITVSAGPATHFAVTAPSTAVAGTAFSFTITALDAANNTAASYAGTVHFTSSDSQATLPANATLAAGVFVFSATLKTAGNQTVTATDTGTGAITGTSSAITVSASAATHFTLAGPASAVAGSPLTFTVTALDASGNVAAGYKGTVHFASTDTAAVLPANATLTAGIGTFTVTLKTAGNRTLTATDTLTSTITANATVAVAVAALQSLAVSAPASTTAGTAFTVTVSARDPFGNTITGYTGTVHFTDSDPSGLAFVPADYAFTNADNGVHVFTSGSKLITAGNQTLTATDTLTGALSGSATVSVAAAAAQTLIVSGPPTEIAGTPISITVTAKDQFGNIATGYRGTVHFTKSDAVAAAFVPADYAFVTGDAGVHVFAAGVRLVTAGSQAITVTDTANGALTANSAVTVLAATAQSLIVTAPSTTASGNAVNITVTAKDQFNNIAAGYTGTVQFTSTDTAAVLPANSTLTAGVAIFSATLNTAGNQTVTATDSVSSAVTGHALISVTTPAPAHFVFSAPGNSAAGSALSFTVTALSPSNSTLTTYKGTVHFTSTDAQAVLPADTTLINGTGIFTATLRTAGSQTLTATDTVTTVITGTSGAIAVTPLIATHLAISGPTSAAAGSAFNITVTPEDQFNNTATAYNSTVDFTSTDAQAVLPALKSSVSGGPTVFAVTLKTGGSQTVTVTDTQTNSVTGTSVAISVSVQTATHFVISAPASGVAGTPFQFTVTAEDAANSTVTGYTGTVHFTSSDAQAVLPANSTLTGGVGTFTVTLSTSGGQTLTATDTAASTITGVSSAIVISAVPAPATHFAIAVPFDATAASSFTVTVTALDAANNTVSGYTGTVHFTSTDSQAVLPADVKLTNGVGQFSITLNSTGSQSITATDTVSASITATSSTITVSAASALTPDQRYVQALYHDVLGRTGSLAEINGWVGVLNQTGHSLQTVATDIEDSLEGRTDFVNSLYVSYLGRQAKDGEESGWVQWLMSGASEQQIQAGILGSKEFASRANALIGSTDTNANFVRELYQVLLQRQPSTAELTGWLSFESRSRFGVSTESSAPVFNMTRRIEIAADILTSSEYLNLQVSADYENLLNRPASQDEVVAQLAASHDLQTIRILIESSSEYYADS